MMNVFVFYARNRRTIFGHFYLSSLLSNHLLTVWTINLSNLLFLLNRNWISSGVAKIECSDYESKIRYMDRRTCGHFSLWLRVETFDRLYKGKKVNHSIIKWQTDGLTDWLTDWLTDGLTDWLNDWLTDWMTDWMTDWLIDWLAD